MTTTETSDEPPFFHNYVFPRPWGEWRDPRQLIRSPIGLTCNWCDENIAAADWGLMQYVISVEPYYVAMHRECCLRGLLGSVGHQQGTCHCYGGTAEDPPEMTQRQAARAAVKLFYTNKQRDLLSAFKIGTLFRVSDDETKWRVTDVGSRVVVAIKLTEEVVRDRWDAGPPYAVDESVFDEYDLPALQIVRPNTEDEEPCRATS